jgi:hypothetical protein
MEKVDGGGIGVNYEADTKATLRCTSIDQYRAFDKCIHCGQPGYEKAYLRQNLLKIAADAIL